MLFVTNLMWTPLIIKTVKHMLYLFIYIYIGYILLRFVDIVKSRSIFQFSLNISTSKCDWNVHCTVKTAFLLYFRLFSSSSR